MKRKNMKTKILSQIAALMALGVATQGCSDNWTADVGGEGEGVLATSSLLPTVTNEEHFVEEIRGAQQNGRSGGSRASINLTDFIVQVVHKPLRGLTARCRAFPLSRWETTR
jgi:hypothetical protein